jgi:hypothetical protein
MQLLFAPAEYWTAKDKDTVCNGCGTKGLVGYVIPDTLYGLSITAACDIHDFMYDRGLTLADKEEADRVFLNNILRLIETKPGKFLQFLRCRRAMIYYSAVRDFGGPAFWAGKNKAGEMMAVA